MAPFGEPNADTDISVTAHQSTDILATPTSLLHLPQVFTVKIKQTNKKELFLYQNRPIGSVNTAQTRLSLEGTNTINKFQKAGPAPSYPEVQHITQTDKLLHLSFRQMIPLFNIYSLCTLQL